MERPELACDLAEPGFDLAEPGFFFPDGAGIFLCGVTHFSFDLELNEALPRDQSLHRSNKRRYFQYAVRSTLFTNLDRP